MTEPKPPAHPEIIAAAAARWVARRDAGLLPSEEREFARWLAADPRHAAALEHFASAWSVFDRAPRAHAVNEVIRSLQARIRRRRRNRVSLAAAACALVLAAGFAWRSRLAPSPVPAGGRAATSARVIVPEQRILPDGSIAELKVGAEIVADYSGPLRRVALLKGEAHFKVAKNKERPFVVSAGGIEVRAVGTAFDVQLSSREVEVLVTEGRVAVEKPADSASSAAGIPGRGSAAPFRLALVDAGSRLVVPAALAEGAPVPAVLPVPAGEAAERLAWRSPRVEFSGTPLADAVELMNRAGRTAGSTSVRLVIDPGSPRLAAEPVSGLFRADNAVTFVRMLELSLGVQAERRAGGEIVLRQGP